MLEFCFEINLSQHNYNLTSYRLPAAAAAAAAGERWEGDIDFRVNGFGGGEHISVGLIDTFGPQNCDTREATADTVIKRPISFSFLF